MIKLQCENCSGDLIEEKQSGKLLYLRCQNCHVAYLHEILWDDTPGITIPVEQVKNSPVYLGGSMSYYCTSSATYKYGIWPTSDVDKLINDA